MNSPTRSVPACQNPRIPPGKALHSMFLDGELDAVFTFDSGPYPDPPGGAAK
ncbi:hypothetical protein ACPCTO_34480 [Streptomyces olivoreticuli]